VNPDTTTKLRLFADSGGFCQKPDCLRPLFKDLEDDTIYIAEMAHIIAASGDGPRSDKIPSETDKAAYSNLILLCPSCHTEIDKAEIHYPVDLILSWKTEHRNRLHRAFGIIKCTDRHSARHLAQRFLRENKVIFETYGPMGDERFNPESPLPKLWSMKMLDTILPNNRNLLSLCDANEDLLTNRELVTVERFRQHVADLEARHISRLDICGQIYPPEMDDIFDEETA
jgi:hypothetical protein